MPRFGRLTIGAMLMTAVLVNASDYSFLVPLREVRVEAHRSVVAHSAPSPSRYRLLVPVVLDLPIRALAAMMPYDKAFGRVYAVFHFVALTLLLAMLVYELTLWFTLEQAMVGALLVGSTIRMALRQGEYGDLSSIPLTGVFAPHSLLEPIFIAMAVILSLQNRPWLMAWVTVVATLNSEVGALLPLVYLAIRGVGGFSLKTTIALVAVWAVVTAGLRFAVGGSTTGTEADVWRENLAHLSVTVVNVALFIGPLWALAGYGWKRAPEEMRRASWLIPVYGAGVAIAGFWWDVRVLMGLYPLLTPLILSAMFEPRVRSLSTT